MAKKTFLGGMKESLQSRGMGVGGSDLGFRI